MKIEMVMELAAAGLVITLMLVMMKTHDVMAMMMMTTTIMTVVMIRTTALS